MLKNPRFTHDLQLMGILSLIGQGGAPEEIETGIFLSNSFSMGNSIGNEKDDYFDFGSEDEEYLGAYGVSDSIEQVKEKYSRWLNNPELDFCVSFTEIKKSEQSPDGGWRWHKWGEYIGDKQPQCEYLYDEGDDIDSVFVYHIYHLLD